MSNHCYIIKLLTILGENNEKSDISFCLIKISLFASFDTQNYTDTKFFLNYRFQIRHGQDKMRTTKKRAFFGDHFKRRRCERKVD